MNGIRFYINYKTNAGGLETFQFDTGGQSGVSGGGESLALSANYNDGAFRYYITLELNGSLVLPGQPGTGFKNIADLMDWVRDNWYIYGVWHVLQTQNKVLVYVRPNMASSGNLTINSENNLLTAEIPKLEQGDFYALDFTDAKNERIAPWNDFLMESKGGILSFAREHYSLYGGWDIDGNTLILKGKTPLDGYNLRILTTGDNSAFDFGYSKGFES